MEVNQSDYLPIILILVAHGFLVSSKLLPSRLANIANLSKIVYPQKTIPLRTGVDIFTVFRQELVNFLEACKEIEEVPHSYGVTMPFQSASPLKKRSAKRAQVDSESSVISKRQKVAVTR